MGNSNGTLAEYWDAIESTPGLQGGFIWEWRDHGLVQTLPDGRTRWAYGGDFGDEPERRQLRAATGWSGRTAGRSPRCGSTSDWPRRSGSSGSPADVGRGRIEIANHQHFTDLGWLRARYALTAGGVELAAGSFDLPALGPGEAAQVELPGWPASDVAARDDAFLTVVVTTAAELPWAPAGFEVCALQLPVGDRSRTTMANRTAAWRPAATSRPRSTRPGIWSTRCSRSRRPSALWRAPTDNDRIGGMADRWAELGVDRLERRLVAVERDGATTVVSRHVRHAAARRSRSRMRRATRVLADGGIQVTETAEIPDALADLARVGTVLEVAPGSRAPALVRLRPARDLPGPQARRPGRRLAIDRDRPVRAVRPPAGERRPRRCPLARADRRRRRRPPDRARRARPGVGDAPARGRPRRSDPRRRPRPRRPRRSSTSTPPIAAWAPRAAVRTRCREYRLAPGTYRWTWTLRDVRRPA